MSEYCREQHPLLCEAASDEEHYSPRYYPRIRATAYKRHAKSNLKGAAAILIRWPDHWASFLTYLWIGIGMISLATFIIYNSLFAFSMLPTINMKPATSLTLNKNDKAPNKSLILPEVYMHIFVNQNEVIDLIQYMPYVEMLSNTFIEYKFNLIVVVNDTNVDWLNAAENNEFALNMLWTKDQNDFKKESYNRNINIEHITISAFMENSPLRKYWRTLPLQLIEFVARTVSIWEKGGVAFNPNILTPKFQHTLYIEKLQNLLNKYAHTNKVINPANIINKSSKGPKKHKKLNNIRDIIDDLESEDISTNAFSHQTLSEAENRDIQFIGHESKISTITVSPLKNADLINTETFNKIKSKIKDYSIGSTNLPDLDSIVNSTESLRTLDSNNTSTKKSLLPLFLDFLFHNKADITITNGTQNNPALKNNSHYDLSSKNILRSKEKERTNVYKSGILSVSNMFNKSKLNVATTTDNSKELHERIERNRLTIDLKGNIIATDTACHAFLGTIFSNIIHHSDEETITDFIIAELSVFCKGLLTSCVGIDLILL